MKMSPGIWDALEPRTDRQFFLDKFDNLFYLLFGTTKNCQFLPICSSVRPKGKL